MRAADASRTLRRVINRRAPRGDNRPKRATGRLVLLVGAACGPLCGGVAPARPPSGRVAHTTYPSDHHHCLLHSRAPKNDCAADVAGGHEPLRDAICFGRGVRAQIRPAPSSESRLWTVTRLHASIPEAPFQLYLNGARAGATKLVALGSRVGNTQRFPQAMVIAASGYLRLKPGADPARPLPFGQSLVLGPAIFGTSSSSPGQPRLFFNPQLQRVDITQARDGSLRIRIIASDRHLAPSQTYSNQLADLSWDLVLHRPTRRETRLDVHGTFRFTERVTPDPTRTAEFQSYRLAQISSMYIDPQRHDVDALRYRSQHGPVGIALTPGLANTLLPATPSPFASNRPTLDVVQNDKTALPNGNTPSYRISFKAVRGPSSGPLTPRAFFNGSQDLNDDNLGVWVYQRPPTVITSGTRGAIAYTVIATADPLRQP